MIFRIVGKHHLNMLQSFERAHVAAKDMVSGTRLVLELPLRIGTEHREALIRYRDHRIDPGGFLRAVLENDLGGSVWAGDHEAQIQIATIFRWISDNLPGSSYGRRSYVVDWLQNAP